MSSAERPEADMLEQTREVTLDDPERVDELGSGEVDDADAADQHRGAGEPGDEEDYPPA